jgi:hypothetical protein
VAVTKSLMAAPAHCRSVAAVIRPRFGVVGLFAAAGLGAEFQGGDVELAGQVELQVVFLVLRVALA